MENRNMTQGNDSSEKGSQDIVSYVISQVEKGISHDEIKKQLQSVGWSDDEIDSAYANGLVGYGVPVPVKGDKNIFSKKSSAVDIVINIFSFVLLGIVSFSLGVLLYEIIDHYFPNILSGSRYRSDSDAIHYSIASLLIAFPLYYFSMRFWFKKFREDEGRAESRISRFITYLVLLVAAIVIAGDLIAILFNFLQGEITIRFFLQAIVILLISGGIFGFYFLERKEVQYKKGVSRKIFQGFSRSVAAFIVVSIVVGFAISDSPATERKKSFDDRRSNDLQSISTCVENYAIEHHQLPDSLDFTQSSSEYSYCNRRDPETGAPYEYRIIRDSREVGEAIEGEFQLCATFTLSSRENVNDNFYGNISDWYDHDAGRDCDNETVVIKRLKDEMGI